MTTLTQQQIDRTIAKIKQDTHYYQSLPIEYRSNKEITLEAVNQYGLALDYTSQKLQNDKEVVLEAVKQNPFSLQLTSKELKNDKEVVLTAAKQNGVSLQFASRELKNDKEVVLEAVKQNPGSLRFASTEIKDLCKDKDPVKVLESLVLSEQLEQDLPSQESNKKKMKL